MLKTARATGFSACLGIKKWEVSLGKQFKLTTTDKHSLGAYRADPQGTPKGGLVVVQEIFGVNHHIRAVCDRLAALGYGGGARRIRPFRARLRVRLYARRDRARPQLFRQ